MHKLIAILATFVFSFAMLGAQELDPATLAKRDARRNLTVKQWNTDAKTKTRWLDRVTTYDHEGRKIEEIEYASYGQKWRQTYEYGANGRVVKEVEYDDRNKPVYIRKYEWNEDGTKKKQYNYAPNGKLLTIKVFEYIFTDPE
ncbi:MAG: hypothetical protein MSH61_06275 [Bacteroidales bacterium]|nr:hypothetical protein [Bacteroidales bacterium]MCI7749942.1 hypothetical protein [Bacteroidales bacterium]